jgi:hypothetical protein
MHLSLTQSREIKSMGGGPKGGKGQGLSQIHPINQKLQDALSGAGLSPHLEISKLVSRRNRYQKTYCGKLAIFRLGGMFGATSPIHHGATRFEATGNKTRPKERYRLQGLTASGGGEALQMSQQRTSRTA